VPDVVHSILIISLVIFKNIMACTDLLSIVTFVGYLRSVVC